MDMPSAARRHPLRAGWLLLSILCLPLACTENSGALFGGGGGSGGGGDPGGGGGGGNPPGPAAVPVDGSLKQDGEPVLEVVFPAMDATGVDVQAPLGLWFSESINLNTISTTSILLRVVNGFGSMAFSVQGLAGDRCILLSPSLTLAPMTEYELVLTDGVTDLDGDRPEVEEDGTVVARFTTAPLVTGVPPQVLGTFPPDGSVNIPNDSPLVVLFSKPIDFSGVSSATTLSALSGPASFNVPESHLQGRVVVFDHLDDDLDLADTLQVVIEDSLTDTEFDPNPLASDYAASWETLSFARPASFDLNGEVAVNLANYLDFPT
ncbi:MAG: Ig-like domain-containing protein, partial [Planctomycetes bacterium]|nr:Ig-like domain-containing protein [Planctomycetota bacterium]